MIRYPDHPTPCLIGKVSAPFGALSNMSPHPIEFDGAHWPRAEQAFQAMRFAVDDPIRDELRNTSNPMRAKMLAKAAADRMAIKPRSDVDRFCMLAILRAKHAQHADVRAALDETRADICEPLRPIIEDCSNRATESGLFWGCRRVVQVETPFRDKVVAQRAHLIQLGNKRTAEQESALVAMEAELARRTETYWEGHNWLGRLWMEIRDDGISVDMEAVKLSLLSRGYTHGPDGELRTPSGHHVMSEESMSEVFAGPRTPSGPPAGR